MSKKYKVISEVKFPMSSNGWEEHDVDLSANNIAALAKESVKVTKFIHELNFLINDLRKTVLMEPATIAKIVACAKENMWVNKLEVDIGDKFQVFFDIRVTPEEQKSWAYTLKIEAVKVLYAGERVYCNPSYGVVMCV